MVVGGYRVRRLKVGLSGRGGFGFELLSFLIKIRTFFLENFKR